MCWFPHLKSERTLSDPAILRVLDRARNVGLLGPGQDLPDHVAHARAFAAAGPPAPGGRAVDLGSGNGLPGLVLAGEWPDSMWWLVEVSAKRCDFLRWAVSVLEVEDRVEVLQGAAESLTRDERYRASADLVVARGFGPPAATAECGGGFLRIGGRLVVSEPPDEVGERWSAEGLALLGMVADPPRASQPGIRILHRVELLRPEYPRREGIPRRRPLF